MTDTMFVECDDCGCENEVECYTDHDEDGNPHTCMSSDRVECVECGETLMPDCGGMSDYQERMWERKQMGLSNF